MIGVDKVCVTVAHMFGRKSQATKPFNVQPKTILKIVFNHNFMVLTYDLN